MLRLKPILIGLVIVAAMGTGGIALFRNGNNAEHPWFKLAPAEDNELFRKVLDYRNKGDFDAAVSVALKGIAGKPPDDFLLETIADTYFERAQKDPAGREQWVKLAVQYSERALEVNPTDPVNVFNVGESYLTAGMNLPTSSACDYYQKSLETLERLQTDPILKNESALIEGERVSMEPYRKRLGEKITQVRQLAAGCPAAEKKP
jgi:tetratricopeptide (TPR) repeat protein